jgi:hypothetical protein
MNIKDEQLILQGVKHKITDIYMIFLTPKEVILLFKNR